MIFSLDSDALQKRFKDERRRMMEQLVQFAWIVSNLKETTVLRRSNADTFLGKLTNLKNIWLILNRIKIAANRAFDDGSQNQLRPNAVRNVKKKLRIEIFDTSTQIRFKSMTTRPRWSYSDNCSRLKKKKIDWQMKIPSTAWRSSYKMQKFEGSKMR